MRRSKLQYDQNGNKLCTKCHAFKSVENFHKYSKSSDGLKMWCKLCVKEYDFLENEPKRVFPPKVDNDGNFHCRRCDKYLEEKSFKRYKKSYCASCTEYVGSFHNLKRLGISPEEYFELERNQNSVCKICGGKDKKRLAVDHNHSCCNSYPACGKCVRGLLCSRCNKTLGMVKDDIDILNKMIKYLSE
jgi:hypothetical protein